MEGEREGKEGGREGRKKCEGVGTERRKRETSCKVCGS